MKKKVEYFPCWVCGEPQDTAPNRLCIKCQCCVADFDSIYNNKTFKEIILEMRNKQQNK